MQVLKEEVKVKIIEAAKDEFFLNGYEKASMRGIAGKAGITAGNLYRYFKNKDELFECIVGPIYNMLFYQIEHHNDEHDQLENIDLNKDNIMRLINESAVKISELLSSYKKSFLILIDGSRGTKYAGVKELAVTRLAEHMKEHHSASMAEEVKGHFEPLARAIATSFVEGYLDIIRAEKSDEITMKAIKDYTYIMLTGLVNVIV